MNDAIPPAPAPDNTAVQRARNCVYQFFALAFSDPLAGRHERLSATDLACMSVAAGDYLRHALHEHALPPAPGERPGAALDLRPLQSFFQQSAPAREAEYRDAFGLMMSKACPPYETEYCPQTFSVYRSHQLADIAGYYRAFGVEPSRQHPERPDHLALELEFMAWLIGKALYAARDDQRTICEEAQKSFFQRHLAWWTPAFTTALQRQTEGAEAGSANGAAPRKFYSLLAAALSAFINLERSYLRLPPPTELATPSPDTANEGMECGACGAAAMEPTPHREGES